MSSDDRVALPDASAAAPPAVPAPAAPVERHRRRRGPTGWDVLPLGKTPEEAMAEAEMLKSRHARRLYVGGLSDVTEQEIADFFTNLVRRAVLRRVEGKPILSVFSNPERKFAFVEFNSVELANAFFELTELMYKGRPLKIKRSDDYNPNRLPAELRDKKEPLNFDELPLSSRGASAVPHAGGVAASCFVLLQSIQPHMGDDQLQELAAGIVPGSFRGMHVQHGAHPTQRTAMVEYDLPDSAERAATLLNNLDVGGVRLQAVKVLPPTAPAAVAPVGAPSQGGYGAPPGAGAAPPAMLGAAAATPVGIPSTVVLLEGMVSPEELASPDEVRDIAADVKQECSNYGSVTQVYITPASAPKPGRVFAVFADVRSAVAAATALAGRRFAGRIIVARYYDDASYHASVFHL